MTLAYNKKASRTNSLLLRPKDQNAAERDQEVTFDGVFYYITSTVSMPKVSRCLTRIAFAMFAVDLGTVYGLLEKGYGTVMGFYIRPAYRKQGLGKAFWFHIEETLRGDGASKFYLCPDSVTGVPFWSKMGFADSGLTDPDDEKPIYTKRMG